MAFLGGLFNSPYSSASDEYKKYLKKAAGYQQPYQQAGADAIPQFQDWLGGMSNPSEFINSLMGGYEASPYSQYMQDQSMRASQNAASASGLMGSTPFQKQAQQNASNIAGQDMNQWLQNVLGVNTQYGSGLQNLMGMGQGAANNLSKMFGEAGFDLGQAAYGNQSWQQANMNNLLGSAGFGSSPEISMLLNLLALGGL